MEMKNKKKGRRKRKRRKRRRKKKKSMRIGGKSVKRKMDTSYAPLIYIAFGVVSVIIFLSAIAGIVVSSIFLNKTDNDAWLWMLLPSILIVIGFAVCGCLGYGVFSLK